MIGKHGLILGKKRSLPNLSDDKKCKKHPRKVDWGILGKRTKQTNRVSKSC